MVGFFVRQSYGYLCAYSSSFSRAPTSVSASMMAWLPSPSTLRPANLPASSVKFPSASTGERAGRLFFRPTRKSSAP
eukprot:scaffold670_cov333-Pavlova_lutheri.AAC.18